MYVIKNVSKYSINAKTNNDRALDELRTSNEL